MPEPAVRKRSQVRAVSPAVLSQGVSAVITDSWDPVPGEKHGIVGRPELVPLDRVKPNKWNPNRMTERMRAGLRKSLEDGWLSSAALLVLGTDDTGTKHNIIIDGEQRWTVAKDMGFKRAPMVFVNGWSLARAKAFTIKANQLRGEWDEASLSDLLRDIQFDFEDNIGLELGFADEDIMRLLAEPAEEVEGNAEAGGPAPIAGTNTFTPIKGDSAQLDHVKLVQLFLSTEQHEEFRSSCEALAKAYGTANITDTVFRAVREARGT